MSFFKRRVKVFGRSVSVALLLFVLAVSVVFAGWYVTNYYADITGSSGDSVAPTVDWFGTPICSVTGGGSATCGYDAEGLNVSGSGLMPNSEIYVEYYPRSTDAGGILFEVDLSGAPVSWVASVTEDCDGIVMTNTSGFETCHLWITVANEETLPISSGLEAWQIVFSASLAY